MVKNTRHSELVQSVIRSFSIVELLSSFGELGISEISIHTQLEKSTVARLLKTLQHLGYVVQNSSNHKYKIGLKLFEMGITELERNTVKLLAHPHLQSLSCETGEFTSIGIIAGNEVLVLDSVKPDDTGSGYQVFGNRLPVYATSTGKVLLAFQPESRQKIILENINFISFTKNTLKDHDQVAEELVKIRGKGYATDKEELSYGFFSCAVPIMNRKGYALAGLCITFPHREKTDLMDYGSFIISKLREVSIKLSLKLGFE